MSVITRRFFTTQQTTPATPVTAPLLPPNNKVYFGMFSSPNDGSDTSNASRESYLETREALIRAFSPNLTVTRVDVSHFFYGWSDNAATAGLTQWSDDHDYIPLVTWQPGSTPGGPEAIRVGTHDAHIRTRMQSLKDLGFPVFLRFAHEMNGNWYNWSPWHQDASGYVNAPETRTEMWRWREMWRRVWRLANNPATGQPSGEPAGVEATNIVFVWCPGTGSVPVVANNDKWQYYPGDRYVDWISADGYAGGTSETWASNWNSTLDDFRLPRTIAGSVDPQYNFAGDKPVMIAETSSTPTIRATYVTDAMYDIKYNHTNVRALVWFDVPQGGLSEWQLDADSAGLAAHKVLANDPHFNYRGTYNHLLQEDGALLLQESGSYLVVT